jgi:hypothetical protein
VNSASASFEDPPSAFDVALETAGVPFQYPEDGEQEQQHPEQAQDALAAFLATFARLTPRAAGIRVLLLAYLAGATNFHTDAALAKRLRITASRFSHYKHELSPVFPSLSRLHSRQRKPQKRNVNALLE